MAIHFPKAAYFLQHNIGGALKGDLYLIVHGVAFYWQFNVDVRNIVEVDQGCSFSKAA
jgi:hypothetical protein